MATSYVFTPMNGQLLYSTFPDILLKFAEKTPDKELCIFYSAHGTRSSITYLDLYQKSQMFAKGLVKMGVKPRDVVGLGLPNTPEWLVCHFGIIMAGAISLGITFWRKDGEDVLHSMRTAGNCVAIIFDSIIIRKFISGTNDVGKIQNEQIKSLKFAIHRGNEKLVDFPFTIDSVLSLGQDEDTKLPKIDPDDVFMIMQTSGTTGNPKLVPKTHIETINRRLTNNAFNLPQTGVFFNPSPFTWAGGYISLNFTRVTTESFFLSLGRSDVIVNTFINIIEKEKCNAALILASILYDMMDPKITLGQQFPLDTIMVGGYPMQKYIADAAGRITKRLIIVYGGTEFNNISSKIIVDKEDFTDYNCGTPPPGFEVKIVDKDGKLLPRNEIGTIFTRSRWRFQGYLNNAAETSKVLKHSGWLDTDDVGYVTSEGEIIAMGRQKEAIEISGAFISPYSIEKIIARHSEVRSVVVIPVPDKKTFQQMCACIIRKPGSTVSWENIKQMFRRETTVKDGTLEMNTYFPRYHVFLEHFPVTNTGKVIKSELALNAVKLLKLK